MEEPLSRDQPESMVPDGNVHSLMRTTFANILSGLTGLAASDRAGVFLSVGRVMQASLSGKLLSQLVKEWEALCRTGRIKSDYATTSQAVACLGGLLRYLDSEIPDEERFGVLKRIFLVAATEELSDRESLLPQQFMEIAQQLSAGAVLVLLTTYRLAVSESSKLSEYSGASGWLSLTAQESGLDHPELVELHEQALIDRNLLTRRVHSDRSGVSLGDHFRLTSLGYELCKFVETCNYEGKPGIHEARVPRPSPQAKGGERKRQ